MTAETEALIQGSEEWLQSRYGWASASNASAILAKGQGKTRLAYLRKTVAERLTGKPSESYSNVHMLRGNEQEPFARLSYESITGNLVEEVGFCTHPTLRAGYSPDGHVGLDGGIEIKSVIPTVQIETILQGGYPSEHKPQIMFSLWISERQWWDFVSFSPDLPPHLATYIFRVERDEPYINNLATETKQFLFEVDELVAKLQGMK